METELFAAVEAGDLAKVKELLKKETKETIDQVDFYGYTALHAAAEKGRPEMIPLILAAGADINRATYDATFTSLHHAMAQKHWDCAKILIDKGADLNLCNESGCFGTSLHYAVMQDSIEFVNLCISKGADVNAISGQGMSPLHTAALMDLAEIAAVLIKGGAEVNEQDWDGLTPLHVAARSGYGDTALVLCRSGADLTIRDNEGKTAEEVADFVNEENMKQFLQTCMGGSIPDKAPAPQVREAREQREIIVPAGWGPG
jgi:cytohesin